jgi:DNA-binding transcriptional ArsR family regulator
VARDIASEIDALRADVHDLARTVHTLLDNAPLTESVDDEARYSPPDRPDEGVVINVLSHNRGPAGAISDSAPGEAIQPSAAWKDMTLRQPAELIRSAKEQGLAGAVSYAGFYASGADDESRESRWISDYRSADDLLAQDDNAVARVLAALGNRQRLALLKAILQTPATAAELVERLGMATTGQAYHHLKALQAADLIEQEERGLFVFKGPRVQAFLLLLAGVRDMLDPRYSSGVWAEGPEI